MPDACRLLGPSSPDVIQHFSYSAQLSMKFQLFIKTKMLKNKDCSGFQTLRCCTYSANKCLNANDWWHFNIYGHDKIHAHLS